MKPGTAPNDSALGNIGVVVEEVAENEYELSKEGNNNSEYGRQKSSQV